MAESKSLLHVLSRGLIEIFIISSDRTGMGSDFSARPASLIVAVEPPSLSRHGFRNHLSAGQVMSESGQSQLTAATFYGLV